MGHDSSEEEMPERLDSPCLRAVLGRILRGAREIRFLDVTGNTISVSGATALAYVGVRKLRRLLGRVPLAPELAGCVGVRLDPPWPSASKTRAVLRTVGSEARRVSQPPPTDSLHVVHYLGTLGAGGAERQLVYLARETAARGHHVTVRCGYTLGAGSDHYLPQLQAAGVRVVETPARSRQRVLPRILGVPVSVVAELDLHYAGSWILALAEALVRDRPQILHCWLDEGNCIGAVAGLVAQVPRIVLSTRNLNPSHFALDKPWFRETYRALAGHPRVTWVANSEAGAADYVRWAGLAPELFTVIENGLPVDRCRPPTALERAASRHALGISDQDFCVVGMFRLAEEKLPLDFLEVLARASAQRPRLCALHLGGGPLESQVRARAKTLGLDRLRFLGRVQHPWAVLQAADACLLTSRCEGFPNVLLEAQAVGLPVVATKAGGVEEVVLAGRTALLAEVGDVSKIAGHIVQLAGAPDQARVLGLRGREHVVERFGVERMVSRTLELYQGHPRASG